MSQDELLFETLGPVARLTLNRPKAMNALTWPLSSSWSADWAKSRVTMRPG